MPKLVTVDLTRRESQIMEILHRRRRATVEAIRAELPDAPSPSSVRKLLEIMIDRGLLAREYDGPRHVYFPAVAARGRQPLGAETAGPDLLRQFAGVGDCGAARHVVHRPLRRRVQTFERAAETRPRPGRRAMSTFLADPVIAAVCQPADQGVPCSSRSPRSRSSPCAHGRRQRRGTRSGRWRSPACCSFPCFATVLPPWPVIITAAPMQARLKPGPQRRSPQHRWRLG